MPVSSLYGVNLGYITSLLLHCFLLLGTVGWLLQKILNCSSTWR